MIYDSFLLKNRILLNDTKWYKNMILNINFLEKTIFVYSNFQIYANLKSMNQFALRYV